jgi:hypothetical protein
VGFFGPRLASSIDLGCVVPDIRLQFRHILIQETESVLAGLFLRYEGVKQLIEKGLYLIVALRIKSRRFLNLSQERCG